MKYSPGTGDGKSSGIIGLYRTEENGPNDHWLVLALSFFIKIETRFLLVLATKVIPSLCSYISLAQRSHFLKINSEAFSSRIRTEHPPRLKAFSTEGLKLLSFYIYHLSFIIYH